MLFGLPPSDECLVSDDVEKLGDKNLNHAITNIAVFASQAQIIGIQATYANGAEVVEGQINFDQVDPDDLRREDLELDAGDKIAAIEGSFNDLGIDFITITSRNKQTLTIGQRGDDSRTFAQTFKPNETVITIFSGQESRSGEPELIFVGLEYKAE